MPPHVVFGAPALRVVRLHSGDQQERELMRTELLADVSNFDVVVTTYEMAKAPAMASCLAGATWWRCVVLDEGHVIKSESSEIARAVRRMKCVSALLLTGTPIENSPRELLALLAFLMPSTFAAKGGMKDSLVQLFATLERAGEGQRSSSPARCTSLPAAERGSAAGGEGRRRERLTHVGARAGALRYLCTRR